MDRSLRQLLLFLSYWYLENDWVKDIHLFIKQLLIECYYLPTTVLGARNNNQNNKTHLVSALVELALQGEMKK